MVVVVDASSCAASMNNILGVLDRSKKPI